MQPRVGRVTLFVAAAALLVSACGGSNPPRAGSTSTPTGTLTSPAQTGRPSTPATVSPGRTGAPGTTARPTAPPPSNVTAKLDRSCVRRGVPSDVQGLTVRTAPRYPVGYVTTYSDGSSILDSPEYSSGGQGSGFADDSGVYRATWVVPAAAPTGPATVRINAGKETPALPFTVVAQNGRCG